MKKSKRRALLSVSDKTDLEKIARALHGWGIELVSTGGTAKAIKSFDLPVTNISKVTKRPEIMDGRVKTLDPRIHGALLKVRGNPKHQAEAKKFGIGEFDFVIVNLYPFEKTIAKPGVTLEEAIENIDIGGPAMLRSGAKNFESVTVICDPTDYDRVIAEMKEGHGRTSLKFRQGLAAKVFRHTGAYDTKIGSWI